MNPHTRTGWLFAASPADLLIQNRRDALREQRSEVPADAALRILEAHLHDPVGRLGVVRLHASLGATAPAGDRDLIRALDEALRRGALIATWRAFPRPSASSPGDQDDALDARDIAASWFELRLVDDEGSAVPGVSVRFTLDDRIATATTDANGVARVRASERSASAVIASASQARACLRASWRRPRVFAQGEATSDWRFPRDPIEPVLLEPESRRTVVLLPFVLAIRLPLTLIQGGRVVLSAAGEEASCDEGEATSVEHDHAEFRFVVGADLRYELRVERGESRHVLLSSPALDPSLALAEQGSGRTCALPPDKHARHPDMAPDTARGVATVLHEESVYGDSVAGARGEALG